MPTNPNQDVEKKTFLEKNKAALERFNELSNEDAYGQMSADIAKDIMLSELSTARKEAYDEGVCDGQEIQNEINRADKERVVREIEKLLLPIRIKGRSILPDKKYMKAINTVLEIITNTHDK